MKSKIGNYPDNNDMLLTIHVLHYQPHLTILTCSWLCFILEFMFDEALSLLGDRHPWRKEISQEVTSRSTVFYPFRALMLCWHMDFRYNMKVKREESQLPLVNVEARRPKARRVGWTRGCLGQRTRFLHLATSTVLSAIHTRGICERKDWVTEACVLWLWSWNLKSETRREAINARVFNLYHVAEAFLLEYHSSSPVL
jgi:hypothetical protein